MLQYIKKFSPLLNVYILHTILLYFLTYIVKKRKNNLFKCIIDDFYSKNTTLCQNSEFYEFTKKIYLFKKAPRKV